MMDALTLSDLLARRLYVEWYEGIAIVRGVAERLREHQGAALRIPELHQIELVADGSVALTGGIGAHEPVRRLGQLLQAMLTGGEVPVQLRLIVSQATAPIPSYSSLTEFDQALAYFERPDRVGLLKALFARAEAAGPLTGNDVALTLDRIAPLPEPKPAGDLLHRQRKKSRRPIGMVAVLAAVLALSGAAALYVRNAGMTVKGGKVSRATVAAADAVGAAVLAGVSTVSDSVGLGRIVPASAADSSPLPAATTPVVRNPRVRSLARAEAVEGGVESFPPGIVSAYDAPDEHTNLAEEAPRQADSLEQPSEAPFDSEVYAIGANGVTPPVGVRPQLPQQLPPTVDRAGLSRIELIIARDGSVESAKLLGNRRDVQGGMFLSAAKAWEFRPATKDGVPVRYRKTILVSFE